MASIAVEGSKEALAQAMEGVYVAHAELVMAGFEREASIALAAVGVLLEAWGRLFDADTAARGGEPSADHALYLVGGGRS